MAAFNFSKKSSCLSSTGPEILAFGSHCSANIQPILNCFIPNLKLKYQDSENMIMDCVNTVVFNSHQIKERNFFQDIQYITVLCNFKQNVTNSF